MACIAFFEGEEKRYKEVGRHPIPATPPGLTPTRSYAKRSVQTPPLNSEVTLEPSRYQHGAKAYILFLFSTSLKRRGIKELGGKKKGNN